MGIEYHGWIALATSQADWSDSDFEEGFQRVRKLLRGLDLETGHEPLMPDGALLPQMVYLKGRNVESIVPVLHVLNEIAAVFDRSYGELTGFDGDGNQDLCFDLARATRYRIVRGKVMSVDPASRSQRTGNH